MDQGFRLFPKEASTIAPQVDLLYFFLVAVTAFFTLLIFVAIVYLALRYRRKSEAMPPETKTDLRLELSWTIIPFLITLVMFGWSTRLFLKMSTPPKNAMEIHVIGKQWMWKIEHPNGAREINELHIPVGRPVRLIMSSQDVIHSFFIPAFRVKQDVLPGRFSSLWFEATTPGEYHLFCAEYCGTDHSRMTGRIVVMEPAKFEAWLAGVAPDETPAKQGEKLFTTYGCMACHGERGPTMAGLYGSTVSLADGSKVVADEQYLRESIVNPAAKVVAGFEPIMPAFQGQLSEEQIVRLIAYIKSLRTAAGGEANP